MKLLVYFFAFAIFTFNSVRIVAQEFIPLWPKGLMPNTKGKPLPDSIANERIYRVGTPGMYAFFTSKQENKGAAVIICPGGGYERLAYVISGLQLAKWFNTMGVNAFVLNYRLPNQDNLLQREIAPLQDAERAIRIIRSNALEWGIKPDKIGIMGSSLDAKSIFSSLCEGAVGYLTKDYELKDIKTALIDINEGRGNMSPSIARKVAEYFHPKEKLTEKLTERELDIVKGILDGLSYKLIAERYLITIDIVRKNIKSIYHKLQINSKSQLMKLYFNR